MKCLGFYKIMQQEQDEGRGVVLTVTFQPTWIFMFLSLAVFLTKLSLTIGLRLGGLVTILVKNRRYWSPVGNEIIVRQGCATFHRVDNYDTWVI